QFRGQFHLPDRQAAVPAPERCRPHAEFAAPSLDDQRHGGSSRTILRIAARRRAARIVAVEAVPPVGVELGLPEQTEGTEDEAELGAGLPGLDAAAVVQVELAGQRRSLGANLIAAQTEAAAQPAGPLSARLEQGGDGGFLDAILADGGGALAVFGGVQADLADPVVAQLQAGRQFRIPPIGPKEPALTGLPAPDRALIGL